MGIWHIVLVCWSSHYFSAATKTAFALVSVFPFLELLLPVSWHAAQTASIPKLKDNSFGYLAKCVNSN